jgi:guanylate cyclase
MYGLLLEGMFDALRARHGDEILDEIRASARIEENEFVMHETYPEDYAKRLANAVSMSTGGRVNDVMTHFGFHFVNFTSKYGYDYMLKVLGRNLRDFLNGLDNLHDYLRMSYPKMSPPSFFSEKESKEGLVMHYRSKRRGYVHYVMGQIQKVALNFYGTEVEVEIIENEESKAGTHCIFKLHFDNRGFISEEALAEAAEKAVPIEISNEVLFDAFPLHVLFGRNMTVRSVGKSLKELIKDAVGKPINHVFEMVKPPVEFTFEEVSYNLLFHLQVGNLLNSRL